MSKTKRTIIVAIAAIMYVVLMNLVMPSAYADGTIFERIEIFAERTEFNSVGDAVEMFIAGDWKGLDRARPTFNIKYGVASITPDGVNVQVGEKIGFLKNVSVDLTFNEDFSEGTMMFYASF